MSPDPAASPVSALERFQRWLIVLKTPPNVPASLDVEFAAGYQAAKSDHAAGLEVLLPLLEIQVTQQARLLAAALDDYADVRAAYTRQEREREVDIDEKIEAQQQRDRALADYADLQAAHAQQDQERREALAVLAVSMPESGLVDVCKQVKQVAISEADNSKDLEAEVTRLTTELTQQCPEQKCQGCGGAYRYDTSISSAVWNEVIRAKGLPEFLCLSCIVREFVADLRSFTAVLSIGGPKHSEGLQVEFRIGSEPAQDAFTVQEENNRLRQQVTSLTGELAEEHRATQATYKAGYIHGLGTDKTELSEQVDRLTTELAQKDGHIHAALTAQGQIAAQLLERIKALEAEQAQLQQHLGRCAKCAQYTCGFCGVSSESDGWTCERCSGIGPLSAAENRATRAEAENAVLCARLAEYTA